MPVIDVFGFGTVFYNSMAVILGIGFGVALEQSGFGNSRKLGLMFYFKDFTVFKVMFTAIVVALGGMTIFRLFGIMDYGLVYLNPTVIVPGVIGGLIMGFGFVIAGYCPGTVIPGLASFKKDAVFYLLGIMLGMFAFGETEVLWAEIFRKGGSMSGHITGGPYMNQAPTLDSYFGIPYWAVTIIVIAIALAGFYAAEIVEKKRGEIVQPTDSE